MAEKRTTWKFPSGVRLSLNGLGEVTTAGPAGLEVTIGKNGNGWYMLSKGRVEVTIGSDYKRQSVEGVNRRDGTNASTYSDFCRRYKQYEQR